MKLKPHLITLLLGFLFLSTNANAAFIDVTLNPKVSQGTLHLSGALGPLKIKFEGDAVVDQVWFSNNQSADLHDQNPDTIQAAIEHQFNVTGLVSSGIGTLTGSSDEIETINPFTFLAIHFGKHELFFKFSKAIDEFEISVNGKAAGLSNFRAYDYPAPVPVPAAVWLFGSAILGLGGLTRRKAS